MKVNSNYNNNLIYNNLVKYNSKKETNKLKNEKNSFEQGVILELSGKNNFVSLEQINLNNNDNLEKGNGFNNINRNEISGVKTETISYEEVLNNAIKNIKDNFGIELDESVLDNVEKSIISFDYLFSNKNNNNVHSFEEHLIRKYLFKQNDPKEIIQEGNKILENLNNFYDDDSEDYKRFSDVINKDIKRFSEIKLGAGMANRFIILEKTNFQNTKKSNSIFDKFNINLKFKNENIDYEKYSKDLKNDVSTITKNMIDYFEKHKTFNGFDNNIASQGTVSFTYDQIKNVEGYDKFSGLIEKLYSSETFEEAEETFKELENLVNNKDYSSNINKEKFKLIEKDFKKLKDLVN